MRFSNKKPKPLLANRFIVEKLSGNCNPSRNSNLKPNTMRI